MRGCGRRYGDGGGRRIELTSLRERRGRGTDAAEGADHVARRGMLEGLQAVRRPPWKRPAGAAEQDAADAVGVDDVRRLAGDLHRVAQGGRRRCG